jgi:hypothetical protein
MTHLVVVINGTHKWIVLTCHPRFFPSPVPTELQKLISLEKEFAREKDHIRRKKEDQPGPQSDDQKDLEDRIVQYHSLIKATIVVMNRGKPFPDKGSKEKAEKKLEEEKMKWDNMALTRKLNDVKAKAEKSGES